MNDRGMAKWLPYKSLVEQAPILTRLLYEKNKKPKPHIARERAEEINEVLTHYSGEEIKLTFWDDGYVYCTNGRIEKIDLLNKRLQVEETFYPFSSITNLERV